MKGISIKAYAAVLGVSEKTAWNKVNEETVITYPEAETTKMELFPEYEFDYLFASDRGAQRGGEERRKQEDTFPFLESNMSCSWKGGIYTDKLYLFERKANSHFYNQSQ